MNINYPPYKKYQPSPLGNKSQVLDFIQFKDEDILKALGLEEVTYTRAKSMFSLGGKFIDNDDIQSFDELRFFGLKVIDGPNEFKYSENLESIIIPKSVTYIGPTAFNGCKSLKKVIILGDHVEISPGAFNGCPTDIEITTNDQGIGFWAIGSTFRIMGINIDPESIGIGFWKINQIPYFTVG